MERHSFKRSLLSDRIRPYSIKRTCPVGNLTNDATFLEAAFRSTIQSGNDNDPFF